MYSDDWFARFNAHQVFCYTVWHISQSNLCLFMSIFSGLIQWTVQEHDIL